MGGLYCMLLFQPVLRRKTDGLFWSYYTCMSHIRYFQCISYCPTEECLRYIFESHDAIFYYLDYLTEVP